MVCIGGIRLAVVGQDSKLPRLCDTEPCAALLSLEISRGEDILTIRRPPMRSTRGTENEFVAVVEYYQRVRRMGGGNEDDTHLCVGLYWYGGLWMTGLRAGPREGNLEYGDSQVPQRWDGRK